MTNIIFFGTPKFILPVIEVLNEQFDLRAIVTQADKPQGRKQILTSSPAKEFGLNHNIPVLTPHKLDHEFLNILQAQFPNIDLCILAAYGKIIRPDLLTFPKFGFLNIHPSLLPLYRGATPTLGPILRGETNTGISLMQMDQLMDHGPIIAQATLSIPSNTNREQLNLIAMQQSSQYLPNTINNFINKTNIAMPSLTFFVPPQPQNHSLATFTPILNKNDGFISFETLNQAIKNEPISVEKFPHKLQTLILDIYQPTQGAKFLHALCLALSPWPGLWTILPNNKRLKIISTSYTNNIFSPTRVQIEGKQPQSWIPNMF